MAGIITHPKTGKIIAIKPAPPKIISVEKAKTIEGRAYSAEDGSILTLYYCEEWYLTTYNANANNVYMFGYSLGALFADAISEVLGADWRMALDINTCYSFCLSSYKIHKFQPYGYQKIWFIQSVDMTRVEAGEVVVNRISPIPQLPEQPETAVDWPKLESAFAHFLATEERIYGILIRTPAETYMVESDLHRMVKNTLYRGGLNVKHGKTATHFAMVVVGAYLRNDPLLHYIQGDIGAVKMAFESLVDRIYAKVKHPYLKDVTMLGRVATACYIALSEKHALSKYSPEELMEIIGAYCKGNHMISPLADLLLASFDGTNPLAEAPMPLPVDGADPLPIGAVNPLLANNSS